MLAKTQPNNNLNMVRDLSLQCLESFIHNFALCSSACASATSCLLLKLLSHRLSSQDVVMDLSSKKCCPWKSFYRDQNYIPGSCKKADPMCNSASFFSKSRICASCDGL